ncbi:Hypothetical predicted protein [Mytilus galloprovincialis]|uniref:Novel STAND NTPase 3 domain-containing protein n=1 Tax=Mytilus galloprovincialis TaxID=29158 RepID=A0A8B6DDT4_MYTGA|nr:Hypothetical predicted protein [Mytilus galloprovincialis]
MTEPSEPGPLKRTIPPDLQREVEDVYRQKYQELQIRSDIRNDWAHCDFREWTKGKYTHSFNAMGQLVKDIGLTNREENRILGELNTWATNGQNFMSGTTLGLEIVGEIRQQTHVLSRYVQTLCTETDSQFIRVQKELSNLVNSLEEHEERLKSLESKTNEHDETLSNLKKEIKKQVEDHIPPHIRAHHDDEIRAWEQDQTTFFKTRATHHILESLSLHNCIVVTGSSGCGKSSNIHHAALHLRKSFGYEIIPVLTGPTDIMNYYNKNKNQVFVVDDICGKETINTQTLLMWRDYSEKMEKIFKVAETDVGSISDGTVSRVSNPRLLISCRLHIYKESQFQRIALFTKKEFNLLSPKLCLMAAERMHMLHKYLPDDIIDNIKQVTENVDYFPLLCKWSKYKTFEEVKKLFTAPLDSIKTDIITIIDTNKEHFCALVLCIFFNDGFDTDWLKLESVSEKKNTKKDKLEHIVNEFDIDLSKEKHRNSLKTSFSTLNGTYLKLRGTEYRMIHDKIYKIAAVICVQHLPECFIKYAPSIFIRDNFIFESLTEIQEKDDLIVLLKDQEDDYFERLLCDLKEHVITSTFNNSQLFSQTFRDKLISFLRKSDVITVLKSLDIEGCIIDNNYDELQYRDKEKHFYTTPLIKSATTGHIDIVQFLIVNVKCDVNKTDARGSSPLNKASARGHTAVAKLLLENNADIYHCDEDDESPLYVACKGGHKDTVELLLQNKADVNQCNKYFASKMYPLCVACEEGHKDIVELLLQNKADVIQCDFNRKSPLHMACEGGHTDIVELLLQNNADVHQCDTYRQSPLHLACEEGHKDIVELLLQNMADVNQCGEYDQPPLYVACEGGHKDTVELLLQNKADVNLCNMIGMSPLFVACEGGHKDIVELLLQNKAGVNQCNEYDQSPLYAACGGGHKDTIELLLQNKADVNQCDRNGESLLFVACKYGQKDIVELLLQYDVNVNLCNRNGRPPVYAACRGGYKEIVELLLHNNADVYQSHGWGCSDLDCLKLMENKTGCTPKGKKFSPPRRSTPKGNRRRLQFSTPLPRTQTQPHSQNQSPVPKVKVQIDYRQSKRKTYLQGPTKLACRALVMKQYKTALNHLLQIDEVKKELVNTVKKTINQEVNKVYTSFNMFNRAGLSTSYTLTLSTIDRRYESFDLPVNNGLIKLQRCITKKIVIQSLGTYDHSYAIPEDIETKTKMEDTCIYTAEPLFESPIDYPRLDALDRPDLSQENLHLPTPMTFGSYGSEELLQTPACKTDLSIDMDSPFTTTIPVEASSESGPFQIVMNNLNLHQKTRHKTLDTSNKVHNLVHSVGIQHRVTTDLESLLPQADILSIPNEAFIPNKTDHDDLYSDFRILIQRALVTYIPELKNFRDLVTFHIEHQYSKASEKKSDI